MSATYELSHLHALEAETIFVMREVVAEFERPVLLFSGGKDSIVMLRLAEKAFAPARIPFPVMHVDTGHNFPEVLDYRDRRVADARRCSLVVASVQEAIDAGRVARGLPRRHPQPDPDRRRCCAAIEKHRFDALFGGARRDEEKARAKERVFSFRDEFGQWDPKNQRPELWSLYNGRHRPGESIRVFPLSNWTELDVWHYIADEQIALPSIYYAHDREVVERDGMFYAVNEFIPRRDGESARGARVRYRTVGDASLTGGGRLRRRHGREGDRRGRRHPDHRARRHPRRRPGQRGGDGRPQARGLLLMSRPLTELLRAWTCRSPASRRRRQVDADRPAALRHQVDLRGPARGGRGGQRARGDEYTNLALLTDGLRAEREQGITIDVAYRYFATPRRKFIIADTPGHIQYTRNMVTGASTADLALILVDARKGLVEQSRRHAFLSSLLRRAAPGAVRQQDGPGRLDRGGLRGDRGRVHARSRRSSTSPTSPFIPISALNGDNIVARSDEHALVRGPVAAAPPGARAHRLRPQPGRRAVPGAVRDPAAVQTDHVTHDYRGYAGQVASGVLKPGDEVMVLPSGFTTHDRRRSTPPTARSTRRSRRCR